MSARDLFAGRECGTENALASLANNATHISKGENVQALVPGAVRPQGAASAGPGVQSLINDFQLFHTTQAEVQRDFSHPQIADFTSALVHAHVTNRPVAGVPMSAEVPLTAEDRAKIRERSAMLTRHQFADPGQQEIAMAQLKNIEAVVGPDPHMAQMEKAYQAPASSSWANDFSSFSEQSPAAVTTAMIPAGRSRVGRPNPTTQISRPMIAPLMPLQMPPNMLQQRNYHLQQQQQQHQHQHQRGEQKESTQQEEASSSEKVEDQQQHRHNHTEESEAVRQMLEGLPDDPQLRQSQFFKFMEKVSTGEVVLDEEQWRARTNDGQDYNYPGTEWVDEFRQATHLQEGEHESFVNEFTNGVGDWGDLEDLDYEAFVKQHADALAAFDTEQNEQKKQYQFREGRPYQEHHAPFEAGMTWLQNGNLSESILAFEEQLQRDEQNSRAWMWLGLAQAENDDDVAALVCLRKAVECDDKDLDAYLALATSATNELTRTEALNALVQWLRNNEKYAPLTESLPVEVTPEMDSYTSDAKIHSRVAECFMRAAQSSPAMPDADVQIALGLLFNMSHEYDKAVDCFRTATQVRDDDYLLWNKLGATLANSSRSQEALDPYQRALDLKPSYVRAQINRGIALLNLDRLPEAATQFLQVLQNLEGSGNTERTRDGVWSKLKTVFLAMDRYDLMEKCDRHNVDLFRRDFQF